MREWRDQYLQGHNNYPHTLEEAYSLLQHHICARRNNGTSGLNASDKNLQQDSQNTVDIVPRIQHSQQLNPGSGRDVVARDDSVVRGADGRCNPRVLCYNCEHYGHYSDNCPERNDTTSVSTPGYETDTSSLPSSIASKKPAPKIIKKEQHMHAATLTEVDEPIDIPDDNNVDINDEDADGGSIEIAFTYAHDTDCRDHDNLSILIDTGSNCSVFNYKKILLDIYKSPYTLRAYTNDRYQESTEQGTLPGFFDVWYNKDSMMNILAFSGVCKKFRVTVDTAESSTINVHLTKSHLIQFKEVDSGLFVLENGLTQVSTTNYSFLNLVRTNKLYYTKREVARADEARRLYLNCNMPGYQRLLELVERIFSRNSPITSDDVRRALHIYGEEPSALQGRMTRQRS